MNALPSFPHSGSSASSDGVSVGQMFETRMSGTRVFRARDLRLRKHADYQSVYRVARKQFSSSMSWFAALRCADSSALSLTHVIADSPSGPRVGLTVGKVMGKAHERNRIKRRMREAVRRHVAELPDGVDLVLHPKRSVLTIEFAKLDAEVLRIFRQAAAQFASPEPASGNGKTQARA